MAVQRESKREYVGRMQRRYLRAGRAEKHPPLGEVVEGTGYSRRHALRLLASEGVFAEKYHQATVWPTGDGSPR